MDKLLGHLQELLDRNPHHEAPSTVFVLMLMPEESAVLGGALAIFTHYVLQNSATL